MEMVLAQIIMVLTLVIMIAGWAPLYITAAIGATFSAVAAGFPLTGSEPVTIQKLLIPPFVVQFLHFLYFSTIEKFDNSLHKYTQLSILDK